MPPGTAEQKIIVAGVLGNGSRILWESLMAGGYRGCVYEKQDGKSYVSTMNAGLTGQMFGEIVAEVMENVVAKQQNCFIRIC